MGDKNYQVAIEFGFKVSENPTSYKRFLEKFESGLIRGSKVVGDYDTSKHIFYCVVSEEYAEGAKKKALDTGLVKKVNIDEF